MGFHLSPLHPRLVDLPLLLISPIQYAVTQQGSLFCARDVEYWQLSVNRGVTCGLLVRLFAGHHWLWWCIFAPCLPALVRVIIFTIVVPASLFTFGPAYILTAGTGAITTTCTAFVPSASSGPSSSVESSSPQILGIGTCCPCVFWKLVTNSLIWSVLQPVFAKAFCRARIKPWLMKKVEKVSVVVTWAGLFGKMR